MTAPVTEHDFIGTAWQPRLRPVKAITALSRVLRNKEATHEVFRLIAALDGPVVERRYRTFAASALGRDVLAARRDLAPVLGNRSFLGQLPEGSLGRAYLDFVTREGLSVEGFQQEIEASGETYAEAGAHRERYVSRVRHAHDLYHVLTGYGRDFIGELSLLAFTRQQTRSRALRLLILTGMVKAAREYPGLPVRACVSEGRRLGAAAADLITADWETLLPQPLASVRRQLQIGVPAGYLAVQARAESIDRGYREKLGTA